MAVAALFAKLPGVCVILGVAGGAVCRRAFEYGILVALLASDVGVLALQLESELSMIHGTVPSIRGMAGGALVAVFAEVFIIFLVA